MANPNGKLLPGIDTGSKKGATSTVHEIKNPCSPMSSKKSLKVMPSEGSSKDILETKSEVLLPVLLFTVTNKPQTNINCQVILR